MQERTKWRTNRRCRKVMRNVLQAKYPLTPYPLSFFPSALLWTCVTDRDVKCRLTPKTEVTMWRYLSDWDFFQCASVCVCVWVCVCGCVCGCVRMGLCNELETWVRLKWLVISPERWEPGAAWIKRLAGWVISTISFTLRQSQAMDTRQAGEERGQERCAGGSQKESIQGCGNKCGMQDMCCPKKKEREIERWLLAFMKKYIERNMWQDDGDGWGVGGVEECERKGLEHH